MKNIFLAGGAGYCSLLVQDLLKQDYRVTIYDTCFGYSHLPLINKNLNLVVGDIRDTCHIKSKILTVLHLSCISNDASFVLDENLSTSINLHAFEPMVKAAKENGIKDLFMHRQARVWGIRPT